jgi:hypothetical protein
VPEHVIFFQNYGFTWFVTKIAVILPTGRPDGPDRTLPPELRLVQRCSLVCFSKKKDSTALFSSARLLTVAFSRAVAPHPLPSRTAPCRTVRPSAPLCHTTTHSGVPLLPSPTTHPIPVFVPAVPDHALSSATPGQVARRGGRRWLGPGQAQAQLAVARLCHHPRALA